MGRKTYNTDRFKKIMLPVELIEQLRSMKNSLESFADLLRRLLQELEELRVIVLAKPTVFGRSQLYVQPVQIQEPIQSVKSTLTIHPIVARGE